MGYFRDDRPFYELILDEKEQNTLDPMWRELDFIASANIRTYVQFYLSESGQARDKVAKEITAESTIRQVADSYLARARSSGDATAIKAVESHFTAVNAGFRWVEKARLEAEPKQVEALTDFAARAYRRPLTANERAGLLTYYRSPRDRTGLDHEDAMRDSVVSVLMSPDFCYAAISGRLLKQRATARFSMDASDCATNAFVFQNSHDFNRAAARTGRAAL